MIEVFRVSTRKRILQFINTPHLLYKGDPFYVPSPYSFDKEIFNKKKNPFFKHSKADFFIAIKDGKTAGRIAAIRNNIHLEKWNDNSGFFGFFDVINDYNVAKALLDKVVEWIKTQGLSGVIGPESYTTNEVCGLLTEGFDRPPNVLMPYNKEYYIEFLARYGFQPILGLKSYELNKDNFSRMPAEVITRLTNRLKDIGITFRSLDKSNLIREIELFALAYNESFSSNWGFIPLTLNEFRDYAKNILKITKPEMVLIAEHNDRIVGFLCAVYNINQLFIHLRNGRVFPKGIIKFLKHKRDIKQARILIMGVINEFRNKGIDVCLYHKITDVLFKDKIFSAEAAYVMDSNHIMQQILEKMGGEITKKYQLYKIDLN